MRRQNARLDLGVHEPAYAREDGQRARALAGDPLELVLVHQEREDVVAHFAVAQLVAEAPCERAEVAADLARDVVRQRGGDFERDLAHEHQQPPPLLASLRQAKVRVVGAAA